MQTAHLFLNQDDYSSYIRVFPPKGGPFEVGSNDPRYPAMYMMITANAVPEELETVTVHHMQLSGSEFRQLMQAWYGDDWSWTHHR